MGKILSLEKINLMLDEYYEACGWDKNGNPTEVLLLDLGLDDVIEDLKKIDQLGKPLTGGIPEVRGQILKPKAM